MGPRPSGAKIHYHLGLWLAFASIILVSFAVRAVGLSNESFWYDEAYTAIFVRNTLPDLIAGAARLELNTPLHYIALKFWVAAAGDSEFAQRLLSVFAGVVTTVLTGLLVGPKNQRHSSQRLVAAALAALWPVTINLSQELRMYALAICLGAASLVCARRAMRTNTRRMWLSWFVVTVAAFGTHVLAAFVFAAQIPMLLAWRRSRRRAHDPESAAAVVASILTGAVIAACGGLLLILRSAYGTTFTGTLPPSATLLDSLASITLPRLLLAEWVLVAAAVTVLLTIAPALVKGDRVLVMIGALTTVLIAAFCVATGKFAARYLGFAVPPLLAAAASVRLPRVAGNLVIPLLLAGCAVGAWQLRTAPVYANDNYRDAVRFLRAELKPDEAVIFVSGHASPALAYYWPEGEGTRWHALPDDPVLNIRNALDYASAVPALNHALTGKRGAWLLLWQDVVIDPSTVTQTLLRRQAHKLQPDRATAEFRGLRLMHYTFDAPFRPLPETLPDLNSAIAANGPDLGLSALGCHQFDIPRAGGGLMEVACFWRKSQSSQAPLDTKVSLRLNDAAGARFVQADEMLANFGLPYYAFDKPITTFHYIQLPDGAKAGRYALEMILYTPDGEISPKMSTLVTIAP